jgi:hypothetical protein
MSGMILFDGLIALLAELYNRAEAERSDPVELGRQLREIQTSYELGDIGEEEYQSEFVRLRGLLQAARMEAEAEEAEEEEEEEEEEE